MSDPFLLLDAAAAQHNQLNSTDSKLSTDVAVKHDPCHETSINHHLQQNTTSTSPSPTKSLLESNVHLCVRYKQTALQHPV